MARSEPPGLPPEPLGGGRFADRTHLSRLDPSHTDRQATTSTRSQPLEAEP
jgi:hypothetical protein